MDTINVFEDHDKAIELLQKKVESLTEQIKTSTKLLDESEKALSYFFNPGPGIATPEYYMWPDGLRDDSDPHKKTWNSKLDKLHDIHERLKNWRG